MTKSKASIILLLVAFIGTNIYWFITILDQGITQTYMQSSLELSQDQFEQATILANLQLTGLNSEEALSRIGKDINGHDPFIEDGCIWAAQVCLELDDDHVISIKHSAL